MQLLVEPRPTRQMNMKADEQMLQKLERLASELGASRSQIARALIRNALDVLEITGPATVARRNTPRLALYLDLLHQFLEVDEAAPVDPGRLHQAA